MAASAANSRERKEGKTAIRRTRMKARYRAVLAENSKLPKQERKSIGEMESRVADEFGLSVRTLQRALGKIRSKK